MLQERTIQLSTPAGAPVDRTNGAGFKMAASGGVFFDRVDGRGICVRFDESPVLVPVYAGRSIDVAFRSFTLVHGPHFTGEVRVITYEKGEGVFDAPRLGQDTVPGGAIGRVAVTSDAGHFPTVALFNPPGSGVLAKIEHLRTWSNSTAERGFRVFTAELTNVVVTKAWRNLRAGGAPACTLSYDGVTYAFGTLPGVHIAGIRGTASRDSSEPDVDLTLGPGQSLVVTDEQTAATTLEVCFWWNEYV